MWKPLGVLSVWIAMLVAPHLSSPVYPLVTADVPPDPAAARPAAPAEDPGDPFQRQKAAAGSVTTVHFKNQMGKTVTMSEVLFTLDQQALPTIDSVAPDQDVVVFSGRLSPGQHLMRTEIHIEGNSRGPITYTKGYHFTVTGEQVLTVPENRAVIFTITGTRNKGMTVPFDKQYDIKMTSQESPPVTSSLTN